ncbi:MAG: hypothetical protein NTX88_01410 [Candidatus Atribacteria bacterium]|nr:hypothetical protein [Candidatus Atribacteria bacterium]
MNIFKNMIRLLLVFSLLCAFFIMVPFAFADEAQVTLPPLNLNPSPSLSTDLNLNPSPPVPSQPESSPSLSQIQPGNETLPSFENSTSRVYQDPKGLYTITFPEGSSQTPGVDEKIAMFNVPDNGKVYILKVESTEEANEGVTDIQDEMVKSGAQMFGQSTLNASGKQGKVILFSMDGKALSEMTGQQFSAVPHAILLTYFPGTSLAMIIVVPKDSYKNAQPWILEILNGAVFK